VEIGSAAFEAGADGLTPQYHAGAIVDIKEKMYHSRRIFGPALKPIALRAVMNAQRPYLFLSSV
jgi:hypothetical protein